MNKKDLIVLVVLFVLSAISVLNFKVYGQDLDRPVATVLTVSPMIVDFSTCGAAVTFFLRVSYTSGDENNCFRAAGITVNTSELLIKE